MIKSHTWLLLQGRHASSKFGRGSDANSPWFKFASLFEQAFTGTEHPPISTVFTSAECEKDRAPFPLPPAPNSFKKVAHSFKKWIAGF